MKRSGDESSGGNLMWCYYERNRSLLRFATVGCVNTLVDFLVFTLFKGIFDINYLICQVAGYSAGLINSFIFNKKWTFENKTSKFTTSLQFSQFIIVNMVSLGVSLLGLKLLIGYGEMNAYLAKVIVTIFTQAVNYVGYKCWVFSCHAKV